MNKAETLLTLMNMIKKLLVKDSSISEEISLLQNGEFDKDSDGILFLLENNLAKKVFSDEDLEAFIFNNFSNYEKTILDIEYIKAISPLLGGGPTAEELRQLLADSKTFSNDRRTFFYYRGISNGAIASGDIDLIQIALDKMHEINYREIE